jgi:Rps23 Pro-64 3,4-dihydroxylase Tpa1-like proline 4-hydroxylase
MVYSLSNLLQDSINNTINKESLFLSNLHLYKDMPDLCSQYPLDGYERSIRKNGTKKHYSFEVLPIIENGKENYLYNNLSQKWHYFLQQITSEEYIYLLFKALDIKPQHYRIDVSFFKFSHNDWVDTHIDNEKKIVTNIFYFNSCWKMEWGGFFNLYNQEKKLILSIPPLSNFSVAVKRTEQTFHSVSLVCSKSKFHKRQTLQLEIWKR